MRESFHDAILAAGLIPPDVIEPGRFYRFNGDGKRNGNTAGWCKLFADGDGGIFGDWSTGLSEHWHEKRDKPMSTADRDAWRKRLEEARREADAEQARTHAEAAKLAKSIYDLAGKGAAGHPYAMRKRINLGPLVRRGAWSQRGWDDALIVPLFSADRKIVSLEAINADGDKDFLKGGAKKGAFHPLGKISEAKLICIGEGLATVAVAGGPAVAAMDAGNLLAVAESVRQISPTAEIVFLADNDVREDGRNPGIEAATAAARAIGGKVAIPELGGRKCDFWDVWHEQGAEAVAQAVAGAMEPTAGDSDGWPDPHSLAAKIEPEPYPIDALPDTIRAAVEEVAGFVKAPVPLVASSALAALSLACQAHIDAKRADKLHGPVGLFLLTIADSGERKSTCDGFFVSAIRQYQEEQAEAMKPAIKEHQAKLAAWEAEREGILSAIKAAGRAAKATDKLRADLAQLQQDKPEAPRVPRLILGDETPENLAWSLAKQWPSAGVLSSEAGVVFGSHGMGKESAMRNLALLNVLWDGGMHSIGRRTSESFTVRGARLTMGLMIQEQALREYFAKSGQLARGTGFLARFLVAWPESTQGRRPFSEAPANWPHLAAFHRRIAAVLSQPVPMDEDGALNPAMLILAPDAKAAWVEFHDTIESELSRGGELYDVRDVAAKAADNAARLAALFQQFEHGMGGAVGFDALDRATTITAWHLSESRRFFGELALPAELADAARLDSWLVEHCRQERTHFVKKNHVRQHGPIRDGARLDAAIRELAELDRLRLEKDGKRLTIHLNPALVGVAP